MRKKRGTDAEMKSLSKRYCDMADRLKNQGAIVTGAAQGIDAHRSDRSDRSD